jgi:hypothetical protein
VQSDLSIQGKLLTGTPQSKNRKGRQDRLTDAMLAVKGLVAHFAVLSSRP